MASLAQNGELETMLEKRMAGKHAGRIRAKGGHLDQVNCLSGYLDTVHGRRLAFAMLINQFTVASAAVNQALDAICLDLVENKID